MRQYKERPVHDVWKRYIELHKDSREPGVQKTIRHYKRLLRVNKTLYIDADSLIFYAAYSQSHQSGFEGSDDEGTFSGESAGVPVDSLESYKSHFLDLVEDIVSACETESAVGEFPRFNDYKLIFTPSNNFRYDIYPDYKKSRKGRQKSRAERLLRRWALNRYAEVVDGVEADDVVAYYASLGHPISSGDKDVLKGVAGYHYDYHPKHKEFVRTTREEADRFVLLQTIAGDSTDDIPGIKGLGLIKADKLLPENATFEDVVRIYQDKGHCYDTAVLMRRLVGLDQWKGPHKGLELFDG